MSLSIPEPHPSSFPARYAAWEAQGAFLPAPEGAPFTMILPPPNITGRLHMGHALEHTISDARARLERMRGRSCSWIPGLDHAGIATQALIESQLTAEGTSRHTLGREAFLERCWEWKASTSEAITSQMRSLGASPDWSQLAFTLDPQRQRATRAAFKACFDAGLIYRASRITPWCPRCATALSDIETEETDAGPACSRCATLLHERESLQWFLATSRLARAAREAALTEITFSPASAREDWRSWCERMHDWCLSRQLWWGHQIPIWYDEAGSPHCLGPDELPAPSWTQDEDTLDTWFSSALWPLSALGWPAPDPRLSTRYPQELLITGSDLLFFWAIRMHMLCTFLAGSAPFRTLSLHGMIRDGQGRKMSKSLGNTIDPISIMDADGPDALRLALARTTRPGQDASFQEADLTFARHLLRKLWSITSLAAAHPPAGPAAPSTHLLDRWLMGRLERTRAEITAGIEEADLARATSALHRFILDDASRSYLEAAKPRLRDPEDRARTTLAEAIGAILHLAHPLIPFTTDSLAEALGLPTPLTTAPWPRSLELPPDPEAAEAAAALAEALMRLRQFRADRAIEPATSLPASITGLALEAECRHLGHLSPSPPPPGGAHLAGSGWAIHLDADASWDRERITRRRERALTLAASHRARLEDPQFRERAPAHIQESTRRALTEALEEAARAERALS